MLVTYDNIENIFCNMTSQSSTTNEYRVCINSLIATTLIKFPVNLFCTSHNHLKFKQYSSTNFNVYGFMSSIFKIIKPRTQNIMRYHINYVIMNLKLT